MMRMEQLKHVEEEKYKINREKAIIYIIEK